jgi:hypothetical protein
MVDDVLAFTREERVLDLEQNAAWQILHGVLAYGRDFQAERRGESVNVLDWIFGGGAMRGWTLAPGPVGLRAIEEPGGKEGQGHPDQWIAVISQCGVPLSQAVRHAGRDWKLYDMVAQAMHETYEGKECSWTLIALSRYLDPFDRTWAARDKQNWSLERMIAMEAGPDDDAAGREHISTAACGGTHRLIGMQMALDKFDENFPSQELTGGWARAQHRIDDAIAAAKANQLPSGAFSIDYFERPANSADISEHLAATGHTLEFLALALDDEELAQPWVTRAAVYLCKLFQKTRQVDLECGALYHAAHGLVLYRQRRFGEL